MARIVRQTMIWQELEREMPPGLLEVKVFRAAAKLVWALR
jgi:hypothetical protein